MKASVMIGQSGGPTTVINSSLQGIVETALNCESIDGVYGALNGIDGIIHHRIIDFRNEDQEEISLLRTTPSSILGSVRFKLMDYTEDDSVYQKIVEVFKSLHVKYFFYIGGNDSMDTCNKINAYFEFVHFDCVVFGVPKTIDNDLVLTDHTPGYGSSIKYIATTIAEISQDISCYTKGKVTIVEIMGRDAGWLTAGSKLASICGYGPDLIYLPEVPFFLNDFLKRVEKIYQEKGHVLVVMSEGIRDVNGRYMLNYRLFKNTDDFGHLQLGGVGEVIAEVVNTQLGLPIRSIELNLPQRCASHLASKTDIDEAYLCGKKAFEFALCNHTGKMVVMNRISDYPYQINYEMVALKDVANLIKKVPLKYIIDDGTNVSSEFINYALPLIKNEPDIPYKDGMPKFAKLKKILLKRFL